MIDLDSKPKYNYGDQVYYMRYDLICKGSVQGIYLDQDELYPYRDWLYCFTKEDGATRWYGEKDIFTTKQELIDMLLKDANQI
jgi:hypothetical protein